MEQEANNFSTYPEDAELDPYGEQSLEALEAKLAENRDSLATVREALALSPDEPVCFLYQFLCVLFARN